MGPGRLSAIEKQMGNEITSPSGTRKIWVDERVWEKQAVAVFFLQCHSMEQSSNKGRKWAGQQPRHSRQQQ